MVCCCVRSAMQEYNSAQHVLCEKCGFGGPAPDLGMLRPVHRFERTALTLLSVESAICRSKTLKLVH